MSPETTNLLEHAARQWAGTPFRANSSTRGPEGGVCCHFLVTAVYAEAGLVISNVPKGPPGYARFQRQSIMEPWIDACPLFTRVADLGDIRPGDLVGFRIGSAIHHLAIVLTGERIVHALDRLGVVVTPLRDPTWVDRIAAVWRPNFSS